jgi:predicted O-methyltransferase YrrM
VVQARRPFERSMIQGEYRTRRGMPSDIKQHLPQLHDEASTGGAVVIELGVRSGNSTAAFLAALETHGGHLWSSDINPPRVPWLGHEQWTFIKGDDLLVADDMPDDVDVVFIDTSHHYTQTLAELAVYVPKVKPGGVVLLHDVELERPEGAAPSDPAFPVRRAVDEFCAAQGLTPEYVTGCYGLGVIRIPGGDVG